MNFTRESLPNKIRFSGLCARKSLRVDQEVLTKIASSFITSGDNLIVNGKRYTFDKIPKKWNGLKAKL